MWLWNALLGRFGEYDVDWYNYWCTEHLMPYVVCTCRGGEGVIEVSLGDKGGIDRLLNEYIGRG